MRFAFGEFVLPFPVTRDQLKSEENQKLSTASQASEDKLASTTLYSLESIFWKRKEESTVPQEGKPSWTRRLLTDDALLCSKIRYFVGYLQLKVTTDHRVFVFQGRSRRVMQNTGGEGGGSKNSIRDGDVLYHAMVLMSKRDVKFEDVLEVRRKRFSQSGIARSDRLNC